MAKFDNDRLIDSEGRPNRSYILASARRRAQSMYGESCTADDIACWREKLSAMAEQKAALWRADRPVKRAEAA